MMMSDVWNREGCIMLVVNLCDVLEEVEFCMKRVLKLI